jgi:hypothetical protein
VRDKREDRENPATRGKKPKHEFINENFNHQTRKETHIILASLKLKNNDRTVLVNIDKKLIDWIDQQIKAGKYRDRDHLIESVVAHYFKINATEP